MSRIRTIIFDLGGVIIDLDVEKTLKGFSRRSGLPLAMVKELYATLPVFHEFETGRISETDFRVNLRDLFPMKAVVDEEIDSIWNSMLLGIPRSRLDFMKALKRKYTVIILSNTNSIHVREMYNGILPKAVSERSFTPFANHVYFSHDVHMRKPDREIFRHVIDTHKLVPGETMFLDDNLDNVNGASGLGMQVTHIKHPDMMFDLFPVK